MIVVKKEGIILEKTELEFENEAVLNPAAIREGDSVHLFYRAVRKGNYSTVGYCRLDGPLTLRERRETPLIFPQFEYESHGIEDPRIVKIDDLYYMTFTAHDGLNAQGELATSKDLIHFENQGVIVPQMTYTEFAFHVETDGQVNEKYHRNYKFYYEKKDPDKKSLLWDKNVIFFPRRINGKLAFLHRIRPGIQIAAVENLKDLTKDFWINYIRDMHEFIVLDPIYDHELKYIGGGCPPIETKWGWLLIYHGVKEIQTGFVYSACAALLDLNDPSKEIARLPYALFSPEYEWELKGEVNNVVFPTGTAVFGDTLFIYYGAADERIACASLSLSALVEKLIINIKNDEK
jgi:beta-1,2-mannobiose phosphorylase / 1,2-beta-oligomannan phosphorylase